MIDQFVLVRGVQSGVYAGILVESNGQAVRLKDARNIWRWRGANSLMELSQRGCDKEFSRISEPVPEIVILDAISIIPCSEKAIKNLSESRWGA